MLGNSLNILFCSLHLALKVLHMLIFLHALSKDTIMVALVQKLEFYFVQASIYFRVLM
jgi:hypothetical protein